MFINANLKKMKLAKMQKINQACIKSHKTTRKQRILLQKKNSEYIFLNKKKNIQQIHIFHFLWRRGVFCIIKRKKIKSQPVKNNKKNAINFHV